MASGWWHSRGNAPRAFQSHVIAERNHSSRRRATSSGISLTPKFPEALLPEKYKNWSRKRHPKLSFLSFQAMPQKISLNEEISCSAPSPAKVSLNLSCDQNCSSATPTKEKNSMNDVYDSPIKMACVQPTPATLISTTPALHPHKRCMSSYDDDSFSTPDKLVRRPPSRSLIFETPVKHAKDEQKELGDLSDDDDI